VNFEVDGVPLVIHCPRDWVPNIGTRLTQEQATIFGEYLLGASK
jgi:hypothetical protein